MVVVPLVEPKLLQHGYCAQLYYADMGWGRGKWLMGKVPQKITALPKDCRAIWWVVPGHPVPPPHPHRPKG